MSFNNLARYSNRIKVSTTPGGCPEEKLTLMEKYSHGDFLAIRPDVDTTVFDVSPITYLLTVEVLVWAARESYERSWRWEPSFKKGVICFYHTDFDTLVTYALDWLETHTDGERTTTERGNLLKAIKCEPIGSLMHVSTMDDYKEE